MEKLRNIVLFVVGLSLIIGAFSLTYAAQDNSKSQALNQNPSILSAVQHMLKRVKTWISEVRSSVEGPSWYNIGKDLVTLIGAIIGLCIAWSGLRTWKRQLKGQTEYELSRRILRLCYQYRDTIRRVRDSGMSVSEYRYPADVRLEALNDRQRAYLGRRGAYEARWERVTTVRSDLYPELLEAEVLWDDQLNNLMKAIFELETQLLTAIEEEMLLANPDLSEDAKSHLKDQASRLARQAILYARSRREDPFQTQFRDRLDEVSQFLKGHLKK